MRDIISSSPPALHARAEVWSTALGRVAVGVRRGYQAAHAASPPLAIAGALSLLLAPLTALGLVVDARLVAGAPVWLKPLKFAVSNAAFAFTLALLLRSVEGRPRFVRRVGWGVALAILLENSLIAMQAARGVRSHFNASSIFDASVVSAMGLAITVLWGLTLAVAVVLFRQPFTDRAWGWSVRWALLLTVLGSGLGGRMSVPTAEQIAHVQATRDTSVLGAHTVGAPDGGPGLPFTRWSSTHGDLRVPHFFGLHALQAIPLLAWAVGRWRRARTERQRVRLVWTGALAYAGLFGLLAWQALRGESVARPGGLTLVLFGLWSTATALGGVWSLRKVPPQRTR